MPRHWVYRGMDGMWVHRLEGETRAAGLYETPLAAWEAAKLAAQSERSEAILKGEDGRIRQRANFGHGIPG